MLCLKFPKVHKTVNQNIKNINELAIPRKSEVLFLTTYRSFQQGEEYKAWKLLLKNKKLLRYFKAKKVPPKFCGKHKILYFAKNRFGIVTDIQLKVLDCNTWACPNCQKRKLARLKYLLIDVINLNNLDHYLTLTLDPKKISYKYKNRTGDYITYLFNRFRSFLKREMKESPKYIWIKEFQKNGNAHLHILIHGFIPVHFIRSVWSRIGGGHILKMELVKSVERMAVYVTKYLSKGFENLNNDNKTFLVGERRYTISHSCIRPRNNYVKPTKVTSLSQLNLNLTIQQKKDVYNMLENPAITDKHLVIIPNEEVGV